MIKVDVLDIKKKKKKSPDKLWRLGFRFNNLLIKPDWIEAHTNAQKLPPSSCFSSTCHIIAFVFIFLYFPKFTLLRIFFILHLHFLSRSLTLSLSWTPHFIKCDEKYPSLKKYFMYIYIYFLLRHFPPIFSADTRFTLHPAEKKFSK